MTEQVFLADDLKAAVDEAVAAGDYPSADAVVREALETWQRRTIGRQGLAALRRDRPDR